nr:thiolase family protein [Candidatus Poseidoniales archaeon]
MARIAICGVARTPIGKFRGSLSNFSGVELGILAVKELISRCNIDLSSGIIDEVLSGQVLQAGAGQAPARQVVIGAGLPVSTPATTINKVCGSSLKAAMMAANSIKAGEYKAIIAGGMESMTNAPKLQLKKDSELVNTMIHDGLWDVYNDMHMGNTGEIISQECDISREDMDAFAARSQEKSAQAEANGWFDWERFNLPELSTDEGVRAGTTPEKLAGLKPVFQEDGMVTAGNSSTLSDGASAILVADADFATEQGWEIVAYIEDYCTSGVEPKRVMYAPVPAI